MTLAVGVSIFAFNLITTEAATDGASMSMSINGQTGKVSVGNNSVFTVTVDANSIPLTNGYVGVQAWIDYGNTGLAGKQNQQALWPDCSANVFVTGAASTNELAGCLTGLGSQAKPLFASFYKGSVFSFDLTCNKNASHTIQLLAIGDVQASTSGSGYVEFATSNLIPADNTDVGGGVLVADSIDVNCIFATDTPTITPCGQSCPTPTPTDTPTITPEPTATPDPSTDGASMTLEINGQTGKVAVPENAVFTVVVNANTIPLTNGYSGVQAWIDYGNTGLVGKENQTVLWPDCFVGAFIAGQFGTNELIGCLTGIGTPLNPTFASFYIGPVFSFDLTCNKNTSHTILLLALFDVQASTSGTGYKEFSTNNLIPADNTDVGGGVLVADSIDVNCTVATATFTSTPTITLTPTITPTPTAPPVESVATPIGTAGGSLDTGTGDSVEADLVVPQDALTGNENISIEVFLAEDVPALLGDADTLSRVFRFEPAGLTFDPPAILTISYTDDEVIGIDEATISPIVYNSLTAAWEVANVIARDPTANTLTIAMSHFSEVELCRTPDCDGDGCLNDKEEGSSELLGGRRDMRVRWDYYDVAIGGGAPGQDQRIDLFNDFDQVIQHYAPNGVEPEYDVRFDRGPSQGPNPWDMTAPDGKIDLFNDIAGVIDQFGHNCL